MAEQKTLNDLSKEFIAFLESQKRSTSTILAYGKDLEQLIQFLSKRETTAVSDIKTSDIEAFRNFLDEQKYTPKSVSRKLNAVKTFFRFLFSQKYITADAAAPVAHPRYENAPPRLLSRMEYRALRDAARQDARIATIIELMLQTGIRISELANLKIEDFQNDKIVIKAYESQLQREIPLNSPAKGALEQYLAIRTNTKTNNIFVTKTGKPLLVRNIRSAIDRYFIEAGIEDAKVNDLRNTFIAYQLKNEVDLVTVSRIAGHKRLSTTERYLDFIQREKPGNGTRIEAL